MALSATFDPALGEPMSRARLLVGDTGELKDGSGNALFLLQDATYLTLLSQFTFSETVAQIATGLYTRYAQMPDWYSDAGGSEVRWNDRVKSWQLLVQQMRNGNQLDELQYTGGQYVGCRLPMPQNQPRGARDEFGRLLPRWEMTLRVD
jgi:hypothetical protein